VLFGVMPVAIALMRGYTEAEQPTKDSLKPGHRPATNQEKHGNTDVDDAGL
jgi:hypothetical protein